jgi:hypothetical protein
VPREQTPVLGKNEDMTGTTTAGGGRAVLEDPTGTRARWLRRAGRLVFLLFLAWLLAIVLGGLGLMPVAGIPLTHVLRPSQGPPPLKKLPTPVKPSASDLRPAVSAKAFVAAQQAGKSAVAPGHTKKTTTAAASPGKSAVAPGHTKTTIVAGASPGKSSVAPGQTKTNPALPAGHGSSTVAPGQLTKTTTTPHAGGALHGRSTTAPGQTPTTTTTTTPSLTVPHGRSTVAPGQTHKKL